MDKLEKAIETTDSFLWHASESAKNMNKIMSDEEMKALRTVIEAAGKDRQQIIFEFLEKVQTHCDNKKGYCNECEWEMDDCINTKKALADKSGSQLKAFIEKVEGGE